MSETRKLGFNPELGFFTWPNGHNVVDPTDAERVELAIAALSFGTDRVVEAGPVVLTASDHTADNWLSIALNALGHQRAALARDAAAKERERAEEAAVGAWVGVLSDAFPADWTPIGWTLHDAARALVARGIPVPQGGDPS